MPELDYHSQQMLEKLQIKLREALEIRNVAYLGDVKVVRVPKTPPERFRRLPRDSDPEDCSLEYIAEQWYDPESGQSRNRKYIIGVIFHDYPMALIPNDNYFKYFDEETGKPKVLPGMKNPAGASEAREPETKSTKAKKTTETKPTKPTKTTQTNAPTDPNKTRETSATEEDLSAEDDDSLTEALELIERHRKEADAARIRNEEEKEKRIRNLELYGEQDSGDVERQEAIQYIMSLFDEAEKAEAGTENTMKKDGYPEESTETPENPEAINPETIPPPAEEAEKTSPGKDDNPELQETYREYQMARERQAILGKILNEILSSIRNLAKKRPNDIVNEYKANRINRLLKEAISRYENSGYEDLMELIELPREEEQDGQIVQTGMTYSDLELLLDHYCTILHFIPSGK